MIFNMGLKPVSCLTETFVMVLMVLDCFGAHWCFLNPVFNGLDNVVRRVLRCNGHR